MREAIKNAHGTFYNTGQPGPYYPVTYARREDSDTITRMNPSNERMSDSMKLLDDRDHSSCCK